MKEISNTLEGMFRLLVPATDLASLDTAFVELCGKRWVLAEFAQISDAPPYTCISYSWGTGRTENMFANGQTMSDRTVPAIETTIKASQLPEYWTSALMCVSRDELKRAEALTTALKASQAIWVDALCVPSRDPAQSACLRSMGAIYSSAAHVFVVLPATCSELLHKIHNTDQMEIKDFLALENDDWITRAWTYQETANSKMTLYIAQGDGSVLIHEHDFLNAILTDTTDYAKAQGFERIKLATEFPRLDSLQEIIAEHKLVEYAGRSAYQVMSAMHSRFAELEEDRIYAMIGAVTLEPSANQSGKSISPAEYFIQVCEEKGDYSFIYSTDPRSEVPGRKWRPTGDRITPVVYGLLASGQGLSGSLKNTHLQMNNMCRMNPGRINSVLSAIGAFLHKNFPVEILERLRQKGFTGCGECLILEHGYFFPQLPLSRRDDIFVVISHDVVFAQGAPGLLLRSNGTNINEFCDTGVFIGRCPKESEAINVD